MFLPPPSLWYIIGNPLNTTRKITQKIFVHDSNPHSEGRYGGYVRGVTGGGLWGVYMPSLPRSLII